MRRISGFIAFLFSMSAFIPNSNLTQHILADEKQYDISEVAGLSMISIPGGTFLMGSDAEYATWTEQPVHEVIIESFFMSRTQVTQEQYEMIMEKNPSHFSGFENLPVEQVSWYDAALFCNRLSDEAGLERCYDETSWECNFTANGFRLPTEAEFEYASRAGTQTKFWSGDTYDDLIRVAWFQGNSASKTHPVGTKPANPFGLYDMHGNVWEWCNDWWMENYYQISPPSNPRGPGYGYAKVCRGGRFFSSARHTRISIRGALDPDTISNGYGFRIVRNDAAQ